MYRIEWANLAMHKRGQQTAALNLNTAENIRFGSFGGNIHWKQRIVCPSLGACHMHYFSVWRKGKPVLGDACVNYEKRYKTRYN